jgi:hypothetical protein
VAEYLLCKCKALSSNPSLTKKSDLELGILAVTSGRAPSDAFIGTHVWALPAELVN